MSYDYQVERQKLFTDEGQRKFIQARDHAKALLKSAGCFRMDAILNKVSGDTWQAMACVDRLVELGEVVEIPQKTVGQYRIFTGKWE